MPRHKVQRAIVPSAVRVGDMISVRYEVAGVVYQATAYVGKIEEFELPGRVGQSVLQRWVRVYAANEKNILLEFHGDDVAHPYKGARVYLEWAAPETPTEFEGWSEITDERTPQTGPLATQRAPRR